MASPIRFRCAAVRGCLPFFVADTLSLPFGLMDDDAYHHAIDIPRVPEENGVAGRSLDVDELRLLFGVCDADPSPAGIRDAALIAILYCTGIRRNEVVNLTLAD
jgi:site-specific recombinase XerD